MPAGSLRWGVLDRLPECWRVIAPFGGSGALGRGVKVKDRFADAFLSPSFEEYKHHQTAPVEHRLHKD